MYERLLDKFEATDGVERLSTDGDLIFRTVRDMFNSSVDEIVCSNKLIADRLVKYLTNNLASSVKLTVTDDDDLKKYLFLA